MIEVLADIGVVIDTNDPVDRVVHALLKDITNRRGWRQEWDGFDDDVQAEIVMSFREIVAAELGGRVEVV